MKEELRHIKAAAVKAFIKPSLVLGAAIADIMLVIAFAFYQAGLYDKILEYTIALSSLSARGSESLGSLYSEAPTFLHAISGIEGTRPLMADIFILLSILFIGLYLIFCIFQGISIYLSSKVAGKSIGYLAFMKKFFMLNLLFLGIYILIGIVRLFTDFSLFVSDRPFYADASGSNIWIQIVFWIFIVAALASYMMIFADKKTRVWDFIKNSYKALLIAILLAVLAHSLQVLLFNVNIILAGLFFILIQMPIIIIMKIYLIDSAERRKNDKENIQ